MIRIPLTSSGFLDPLHSFLRFKLRAIKTDAASGGRCYLDQSASCLFNRLRVEGSDGAELERIDSYNVLASVLDSMVVGKSTAEGLDSILMGKQPTDTAPNAGLPVPTSGAGPDASDLTQSYVVRLASGMFTTDKYIPVGFISGAGLTLELTLEDPVVAFYDPLNTSTSTYNYVISDIEFVGHVIEFSTEFEQAFGASLLQRGPVYFHGTSYRNYVYSQNNGQQFNIPISERARSLKGLIITMRDTADINKASENSLSRRLSHNLSQYQFKIGSAVYPQQPVIFSAEATGATGYRNTKSEAMAEALKLFGALSDLRMSPLSKMSMINIAGSDCYLNTWSEPNFFLSIDLERFPGDGKENGINTASQALAIEADIRFGTSGVLKRQADNSLAASGNVRFDTFSMVDVMFRVDASGTVSVIY